MKPHVCAKMQDGDEWVQNEAGLWSFRSVSGMCEDWTCLDASFCHLCGEKLESD